MEIIFEDLFFNTFIYFLKNAVSFLKSFLWSYKRISINLFLAYLALGLILYFIFKSKESKNVRAFFKFLFPKEIYTHPSAIMDYKSKIFKILLFPPKLLYIPVSSILISTYTLKILNTFHKFGWEKLGPTGYGVFIIGFVGFLAQDFAEFFNHWLAHKVRPYWEIHSVHHSAEVLTPVTTKRHHPIFGVISGAIKVFILGVTQGILVWLLFKSVDFYLLFSLNYLTLAFNLLGGSFRHSHIWISFGWFNKIIISPAMHQIHHSVDEKHRNKNMGLWLTIWDRMFGTLYIPEKKEELSFGLEKGMKNPHDTLFNFFIGPLKKIVLLIKK